MEWLTVGLLFVVIGWLASGGGKSVLEDGDPQYIDDAIGDIHRSPFDLMQKGNMGSWLDPGAPYSRGSYSDYYSYHNDLLNDPVNSSIAGTICYDMLTDPVYASIPGNVFYVNSFEQNEYEIPLDSSFDHADMLTDPAYSSIPGNIFYDDSLEQTLFDSSFDSSSGSTFDSDFSSGIDDW